LSNNPTTAGYGCGGHGFLEQKTVIISIGWMQNYSIVGLSDRRVWALAENQAGSHATGYAVSEDPQSL
jgi:hypothetical protein